MSDALEVVTAGLPCTIQDLGRPGFRRSGVPVSGAMDPFALQVGNLLVGNPRGAAALEMALLGPTLVARADVLVCITGADLGATVDAKPAPSWKSLRVRAGEELAFRGPARGVWAYLCVAGGIDAFLVMGSRSTYTRGGFGGLEGRALRAGDLIRSLPASAVGRPGLGLRPADVPTHGSSLEAHVIPGPQEDRFSAEALRMFYASTFIVSRQSDRMGYRLEVAGDAAAVSAGPAGIPSEGTAAGCIQVPPDGQPIVLMADCQTTGGYAKIATVTTADLGSLAQLAPGSEVRFTPVDVDAAHEAGAALERFLSRLESDLYEGASA